MKAFLSEQEDAQDAQHTASPLFSQTLGPWPTEGQGRRAQRVAELHSSSCSLSQKSLQHGSVNWHFLGHDMSLSPRGECKPFLPELDS